MALVAGSNLVGFWRYHLLYRRFKLGILSREDLVLNPIFTILDIPCLLLIIFITFLMPPWRIINYVKLTKVLNYFESNKITLIRYNLVIYTFGQGLLDYLYFPVFIVCFVHPFHWRLLKNFYYDIPFKVPEDVWQDRHIMD